MYISIIIHCTIQSCAHVHLHTCACMYKSKKLHSCMLAYSVCSLNKFSHELVITPCACIHAHLMCRLKCIFIIKGQFDEKTRTFNETCT